MSAREVNFDALVGPTHHYAGLAEGNLASQRFKHSVSNPKRAALQGLAKMKRLVELGIPQAVLPPQDRPDIATLRRLGFQGTPAEVLARAAAHDAVVLAAASSASAMWAANAATVSPSADTADGRVHFTVANLVSQFHRSLEAKNTYTILRAIFANESLFTVHPPLPSTAQWSDEGAANHTRLCTDFDSAGIEVFVFGRDDRSTAIFPRRFPARQSRAASEAVARLNQLNPSRTIFIQQNPEAIDSGVFHNDVIAVGNQNMFLFHEAAYATEDVEQIVETFTKATGRPLHIFRVSTAELPFATAVETYLFNSQLVSLANGRMTLIAPAECQTNHAARSVIDRLIAADNPVDNVLYVDVRQSMQNGGGPACLRLRVVLTPEQITALRGNVMLHDALFAKLEAWIHANYRDELRGDDLADPSLLRESRKALDDLSRILQLNSIYDFQKSS